MKLYLTALWQDPYFSDNPIVAPIHFREQAYEETLVKKLKIGYLAYLNQEGDYEVGVEALPVSRATKRAVLSTVERLR